MREAAWLLALALALWAGFEGGTRYERNLAECVETCEADNDRPDDPKVACDDWCRE